MAVYILMSDFVGETAHVLKEEAKEKASEIGIEPVLFPENGIHPQFQMEIADELLRTNKDTLVVTHSENILLRLLRRIERGDIKHTDVKLLKLIPYVNQKEKGFAYWSEIDIDEEGVIICQTKDGLFEQGYNERFDIGEIPSLSTENKC